MKILRPVQVTDARLTSSSVTEPATVNDADPAYWNSGTTYAIGDEVSLAATHKRYRSLQNSNLNKNPATEDDWWLPIGATNRWKMFDQSVESQTSKADSIVVVLTPNTLFDNLAFLNLDADTIRVQTSTGYDEEVDLTTRIIDSWYSYFFEPFQRRLDVIFSNIPLVLGNVVTITITKTGSVAKCGVCIPGLGRTLGKTQYGASVGILDYSVKETDDFGNTTVVERAYKKRMQAQVFVDRVQVDENFRQLAAYRATPLVWVGADNNYESLIVYGFYKSFEEVITYPSYSLCNLEIEGLI